MTDTVVEFPGRWAFNKVRDDGVATLGNVFNALSFYEPERARWQLNCLKEDGFITEDEYRRIAMRLFRPKDEQPRGEARYQDEPHAV